MPKFNTTDSWTGPILLTHNEFWQCREGWALVETRLSENDPAPTSDEGTKLNEDLGLTLGAGLWVYHRKIGGGTAEINRTVLTA